MKPAFASATAKFTLPRDISSLGGLRILVVCACCIIVGLFIVDKLYAREVALRVARREAVNLSQSLAFEASNTIEIADGVLLGLTQRIKQHGTGAAEMTKLQASMSEAVLYAPRIAGLVLTDERGTIVYATPALRTEHRIELAEREFFPYHRTHTDGVGYVGAPIRTNVGHRWAITVSRRLEHTNGDFAGVAIAVISLDYFLSSFEELDVGEHGVIALLRDNGIALVGKPLIDALIGQSLAHTPVFSGSNATALQGTLLEKTPTDGMNRLTAFSRAKRYSLVSIVADAEVDFLASWRADVIASSLLTLAILLAIVGLGAFLSAQIRHRKFADEAAARLTLFDGLTDMPNRAQFEEVLGREWRSAARRGLPVALLLIEVDELKRYNERYGHAYGDDALKAIAEMIGDALRPGDLAARFGGIEFGVILPALDHPAACALAEHIRRAVSAFGLRHPGTPHGHVTVSIGIAATADAHQGESGELIVTAKRALSEAKRAGRDRCVALGHPDPAPSVGKLDADSGIGEGEVLAAGVSEMSQ